jgi:pSer/pThr/pTyr-binding forkhead associated (FHA) protein
VSNWISRLLVGSGQPAGEGLLELVVVEGPQPGRTCPLEAEVLAIGRGSPSVECPDAFLLDDASVSAYQATVRRQEGRYLLEHRPEATNPTLVNGRKIGRHFLRPGDRIQVGRVVLEARALSAPAPAGPGAEAAEAAERPPRLTDETTECRTPSTEEATEYRPVEVQPAGWLTVLRGIDGMAGRRIPLSGREVVLGRSADCDVCLPEKGVSRRHASLVWEGDSAVLVHLSRTNVTLVNGLAAGERTRLSHGDEIQLADRVVLLFELARAPATSPPPATVPASGALATGGQKSLLEVMEERLRLEQEIEKEFLRHGTFLDVDVVDSYGLKARCPRPEHIIISFERYRAFLTRTVQEFRGRVLNSNGDELMCFFDSADDAVAAGGAILQRLELFNASESLLEEPFRARVGVHTGRSAVDLGRGVAYSPVLDITGHLQKQAAVNGMLISEDTYRALADSTRFQAAEPLPREGIPTYRWVGGNQDRRPGVS